MTSVCIKIHHFGVGTDSNIDYHVYDIRNYYNHSAHSYHDTPKTRTFFFCLSTLLFSGVTNFVHPNCRSCTEEMGDSIMSPTTAKRCPKECQRIVSLQDRLSNIDAQYVSRILSVLRHLHHACTVSYCLVLMPT